jgi:hypothetical protein
MRRKQIVILGLVVFLISLGLSNAGAASSGSNIAYENCVLNVNLIEQDPYPAVPGEYVNLVFQMSGIDNSNCNGTKFGLIPEYPFSLDNNETMRSLASYAYLPNQNVVWTIPYKVKVDKDAVNGENEIKVRYGEGDSWNVYMTKSFNISVQDLRTTFDAVVQEISGSDISIAIANTGMHTANAMVVRIPEQGNFEVSGTNGQMVGNLASGDYTIVSFSVIPKRSRRATPEQANSTLNGNSLKVQIDYTDGIGERRTSILEIPLNLNSIYGNSTLASYRSINGSVFQRRQSSSNNNLASKWYFWAAIAVVLGIGIYYYRKKSAHHKAKMASDSEEPDWIKKERRKERK